MIRNLYADYEALEFKNDDALKLGIYPYYLDSKIDARSPKDKGFLNGNYKKELERPITTLCPIYFSICNHKGKILNSQNALRRTISFIYALDKITYFYQKDEEKQITIWFHNVAYDFRIIIYELFYNDFEHIFDSENLIYDGNYRSLEDNPIKSFSIVGKNLTKYIGANIYYKGFKIMIRDSMSIINSAQDKILAEFGKPQKVEIDWKKINANNLKENMKIIEDRNLYDIISLAECMEEFKKAFYGKFHGAGTTASSMSLDAFKFYLCNKKGILRPSHEEKNDIFRERYPQLTSEQQLLSKGCYSGGISTNNENHAEKMINENLQMLDINSSYPYAMCLPLPYGQGAKIDDFCQKGYNEYIVYIKFKMVGQPFQRCHSENHARAILEFESAEKIYTKSQFPKEFEGYLCLNSIDLDTLKKFAKVTICEFVLGYHYETIDDISDFIKELYYERKKHKKGVLNTAIKIFLNSLYGKFAQDLSGQVYQYKSVGEYKKISAIDTNTIYNPFACAVTAYGRRNWIENCYRIGDDFIYGDTDSLYFKNVQRCEKIFADAGIVDENELGKWGHDKAYGDYIRRGKFLSKKNYMIEIPEYEIDEKTKEIILYDGKPKQIGWKLKLTCVGLTKKYHKQVDFTNFKLNSDPFDIEKMVNIYGGKAMRKTKFQIKKRYYG